jgi:hypothetical protein
MALLRIRVKKGRDGPHSLVCVRADGTMTMQHHAREFFPLHDLTHYAVESVLSYRRGFYGLVADGWDLSDFGTPWPRGRLPADLDPVELVVGAFDRSRATGDELRANDLNKELASWFLEHAPERGLPSQISAQQVDRIRQLADELHARWRMLAPGDALELAMFGGD